MNRRTALDLLAIAVLIAAVFLLYRKAARLWWLYDDAFLIHLSSTAHPRQYFADIALCRSLPGRMFVPLLPTSYEGALAIFGQSPQWWHAAALGLLGLAAFTWYLLLRLWLSAQFAFTGALLFVSGVPLCSVASQLMLLHYTESVILGALSAIFFVYGMRQHRSSLLWISAAFYLAAMLAKEIVIPLPVILWLLPEGRWRAVRPHFIAFAAYACWRTVMIGTLLGGYGWAILPRDYPSAIASLPAKLFRACGGPYPFLAALLFVAIGLGVIAAVRTWRTVVVFLLVIVAVIAPIIPVSHELQNRYALGLWLALSTFFAIGCSRIQSSTASFALMTATLALAVACNRQEWAVEYARDDRMSVEGKKFIELAGDSFVRQPLVPPGAMGELKWLKEEMQHGPRGTGWFYDDLYLCRGDGAKRVWQFEDRQMREITQRVPVITRRYCDSIRPAAPLAAEFHFRRGVLSWRFGPYRDGTWRVVFGDGAQAFDIPSSDAFQVGNVDGMAFKIRYASPAGWVTYSPEMNLDFVNHPDVAWHR